LITVYSFSVTRISDQKFVLTGSKLYEVKISWVETILSMAEVKIYL